MRPRPQEIPPDVGDIFTRISYTGGKYVVDKNYCIESKDMVFVKRFF
jgi:hypothetical protein